LQPVEIGLTGGVDGEDEELGGLVAVELVEAGFEGGKLIGAGFEQEEGFRGRFDLALPAVDGLDGGHESGAGCESLLDQNAAQTGGFIGVGRGGEDETG